jgi:hypothetical protein
MEPWRVYRPVVEDSQHFEEKLDPDPHSSIKLDADSQLSYADHFLRCYSIQIKKQKLT